MNNSDKTRQIETLTADAADKAGQMELAAVNDASVVESLKAEIGDKDQEISALVKTLEKAMSTLMLYLPR